MNEKLKIPREDFGVVFDRLSKFAKAQKFQKTIFSVLFSLTADKRDLEQIKRIFEEIDTD
jgi:hypothetical protein